MAAARLRDIASGRRDALNIDPKAIKIEAGFNPRRYDLQANREHLDSLKASIRLMGVKVPLLVRWDGEQAVLIDGECRLRSCLELIEEGEPIKTVPVLQESLGEPSERLLLAISANTGKPLTLLEAGGAFKRLEAFGWSSNEISAKSGFKLRFVCDAIELASAPLEIKEMVNKGEVTPALAKQTVRQKGDKAAEVLKQAVVKAKANGHNTAKREKPVKAVSANEDFFELGDKMADYLADLCPEDSAEWRLARKWNKGRGR